MLSFLGLAYMKSVYSLHDVIFTRLRHFTGILDMLSWYQNFRAKSPKDYYREKLCELIFVLVGPGWVNMTA